MLKKTLAVGTALVLALGASTATFAKVSPDVAKQLKTTLTPFGALRAGCVSITPLHLDLTSYKTMDALKKWKF